MASTLCPATQVIRNANTLRLHKVEPPRSATPHSAPRSSETTRKPPTHQTHALPPLHPVLVERVDVHSSDDAIAVKSDFALGVVLDSHTIVVRDARLISDTCNACQIGSETVGNFSNLAFSNIMIQGGSQSTIRLMRQFAAQRGAARFAARCGASGQPSTPPRHTPLTCITP